MERATQEKILLKIYENCIKSRYLEQNLFQLWYKNQTKPIYSGLGSEITASVIASLLEKKDYLIPRYRGYASLLSKGMPVGKIVAEMMGKKTGASKGIGDFNSFHDKKNSIPGSTANIGAMFPVAVGLALSILFKKENRIVVHFFGDGEASRTLFGSALHLASLWQLPILFVCENNGISDSTVIKDMSPTATIAERAKGYNIESTTVSDTNPETIFIKASEVINACRKTKRPFLFEIIQKRLVPHLLRKETAQQITEMIPPDADPINAWINFIIKNGIKNTEIEKIKKTAAKEVREAVQKMLKENYLSKEEFFSIFYE